MEINYDRTFFNKLEGVNLDSPFELVWLSKVNSLVFFNKDVFKVLNLKNDQKWIT